MRDFGAYLLELRKSVEPRQKTLATFMRKNLIYQMYSR